MPFPLLRGLKADQPLDDEQLAKRRATNRKSQRKARAEKESLIQRLQEENDRLKRQYESDSAGGSRASVAGSDSATGSMLRTSITHSHFSGQSPKCQQNQWSESPPKFLPTSQSRYLSTNPSAPVTVNIEASRQAFMAVIASICDPHLNTIHAVCAKFSESRGHVHGNLPSRNLNPPRPVNRPLNPSAHHQHSHNITPVEAYTAALAQTPNTSSALFQDPFFASLLWNPQISILPQTDWIPDRTIAGALAVPFLEPTHPIPGIELDAEGIWQYVFENVDISKTDVEELAAKMIEKVKCYGFGPVLFQHEAVTVCNAFPQLVKTYEASSA